MIDRDYVNRLVDAAPVSLYASGEDGARCYWPWRMGKAGTHAGPKSLERHAAKSDKFVLDSNFKDDSITNRDVLDEAARLGADVAVLADVYQDMEATASKLIDGLDLADDHHYTGKVVLPLQAPHVKCYRQVSPSVNHEVWWAVGGLKDKSAAKKIEQTRKLRHAIGENEHIHGLGFGVTDELAKSIRNHPQLLDSIDNATSVSNAVGNLPGTAEKKTILAAYSTASRIESLRQLTPFAKAKSPQERRMRNQLGLDSWEGETPHPHAGGGSGD